MKRNFRWPEGRNKFCLSDNEQHLKESSNLKNTNRPQVYTQMNPLKLKAQADAAVALKIESQPNAF